MMNTSDTRRRVVMIAMMCTLATGALAQDTPLIAMFPSAVVSRLWDAEGDLRATHTRSGDELTITVKRASGRPVESGWAGVCVQNATPVSLQNFTHATAVVESSARVVMDIKLEKTKFQDGTILLTNHGTVGAGSRTLEWKLRAADEVGSGTLAQARRMCFYVLAEGFPSRQDEVTVKIRGVKFDIHP